MTSAPARAVSGAIGWYQRAVSPALPPRCRFHPTCSAYAAEAVAVHGVGRGLGLAVLRVAKCAPWHPGGVDLVPAAHVRPARATSPAHDCPATQEESSVA